MKTERGITLITVIIMVVVISVIAATTIVSSRNIISESKENALEQSRFMVKTAVSQYSAKVATSGVLTPANEKLPGVQNPSFDYDAGVDASGDKIIEKRSIGSDWYLLLEDGLKEMGVTYAEENYLVNYRKNIVIPFYESDDIFELVKYHEENN